MCICNNGYRGDGINNCAGNYDNESQFGILVTVLNNTITQCYLTRCIVDVDECKVLNGGCHQNAICTNVPGTHMCTCEQGFFGNGAVVCFGKRRILSCRNY